MKTNSANKAEETVHKLLIVENELTAAHDLKNSLEKLGYIVTGTTSSGKEALAMVQETLPDLVLIDITMKGDVDGITTAAEVRNHFNTPVVYLTSFSDENMIERAKTTGYFDCIIKPYRERDLSITIEMALYHSKLEKTRSIIRQSFQNIVDKSDAGILILDTNGVVRFVNPTAERFFGRQAKELLYKPFGIAFASDADPVEIEIRWNNGEIGTGEMRTTRTEWGGWEAYLLTIHDVTKRNQREEYILSLNRNLESKVKERTIELTAEHEALKSAQSQLVMREKLASVGQLAAGIAHELNNPIGFIMNNFNALQWSTGIAKDLLIQYRDMASKIESYDEFKADIEAIREKEASTSIDFVIEDMESLFSETQEGFRRATEIIDSMRDFSRAEQAGKEDLYNINKGIETTLVIARNVHKYIAEVVTELGEVPEIRAIPNQLNQVLLNMIVNAAHAIEGQKKKEKGLINIKTYLDGNYVCCDVSDDGEGIPDDLINSIFDPFFTTKETGVGTGLGLSISYDIIVKGHKGDLSVKSELGKGTTFTIKLPIDRDGNEVSRIS